ncbi:MAG TPA: serine/threonine-protein kinase [Myxococcales bacterium]|nr:serine/threonine-protein kinase [Myxococcales bacterium]
MPDAKILQLTPPARYLPPAELGPYRLIRLLGSGGMGEVYLARHGSLGREVAIKLLNPEAASQPDLVRRLFAEARIVNEINHENVVEIHDFVPEPGGRSYYVMELLRGSDLAVTRAERGPFSLETTLSVASQICSALQATHANGVVHRDLKPENVFLIPRAGRTDFVKIIDFGVAKVFEGTLRTGSHTVAGTIVGTPQFMSPEQAGGRPIDGRSDIYALGVLLYWMLSDRLPFRDSGFDKLILARLTTKPDELPATTPSGERLPPELSRVVKRCLAVEPADRFQSVGELTEALSRVKLASQPPRVEHERSRAVPALAALCVLLLAVIGTGLGLWLRGRARPPPPEGVGQAAQPRPEPGPGEPVGEAAVQPPPLPSVPAPPLPRRGSAHPSLPQTAAASRKRRPSKGHAATHPVLAAPVRERSKAAPPGVIDPFSSDKADSTPQQKPPLVDPFAE